MRLVVSHDPREQPTAHRDEPDPPVALMAPRSAVEAEKAIQKANRLAAIQAIRRDQVKLGVQTSQDLRDSATAIRLANVMLEAEADERGSLERPEFVDLPQQQRHAIQMDMLLAVRSRRTVYVRISEWEQRKAIRDALKEFASHKLSAGEIKMLSEVISGRARAAAQGVLIGSRPVTATQFAAATLGFLSEVEP